jgi:uncharacterized LabA/DUF88 family protein
MASPPDSISMALFCDFENVALGVRDAQYEKFDIKPVLERLLLKGSIVVKKAYCDWERYKGFKATMHEANFELIEIPHVRQSGKNSADIRLVVDALDLCYTKSHVNTFVIISGDSDFSPLVSKLRENAKQVIGVGVKQSTSDLLIANCDEFIFYDDLVREKQRALARRQTPGAASAPRRSAEEERHRKETQDVRRTQGVELAVETFEDLVSERGDSGKIWASVLKEAIKRRKPDFSESYYGFRTFGNLLEEAQARGFLEFGRDEKSGAYVFRSLGGAGGGVQQGAGRVDAPRGRDGGPGYLRHDLHAVESAPDAPGLSGEEGGRGRTRERRPEGAKGSVVPRHMESMQRPSSALGRTDSSAEAPGDVWPERAGGSYFSQPEASPFPPHAPQDAAGPMDIVLIEQSGVPETPVADEATPTVADSSATPASRGRRTATSAPRKRSSAKPTAKASDVPEPGQEDSGPPEGVPSAPDRVEASPSRAPRPRKPRSSGKSALSE